MRNGLTISEDCLKISGQGHTLRAAGGVLTVTRTWNKDRLRPSICGNGEGGNHCFFRCLTFSNVLIRRKHSCPSTVILLVEIQTNNQKYKQVFIMRVYNTGLLEQIFIFLNTQPHKIG